MMLTVPKFFQEGVLAAHIGTCMSSVPTPMGFTFCPYRDQSVERWNFVGGCAHAYMGEDARIPGEQ
jgi:hypothetical protein